MGAISSIGRILAKLKKAKSKSGLDKNAHSFNSRQGTVKDTSDMVAYPRRDGYIDDRYSKSLHRGKKQSERFKEESGYFKKDRRKSKKDRRD